MTSPIEPTVVKLNALDDIVNAVPYLLGFMPTDSIVVVSLQGPRERMEFSVRIDLVPEQHDEAMASMLAARMAHAGADAVMVFVYTDAPHEGGVLPRQSLVDAVIEHMSMQVRDALLVTDERVWSYICDDVCCPPEGRPRSQTTPGSLALSAAHVLRGDVVLPDRDAVVATVQPVTGAAAEAMDTAINDAAAAYAAQGPQRALTKARRLARKLRARYAEPPATLSDDEAATLIIGMHDWRLRDQLIGWSHTDDGVMQLLGDLARRALPPLDAPACTSFGWAAYVRGNGVVAATALERALKSDSAYSLAQLLDEALKRQVRPSLLRF